MHTIHSARTLTASTRTGLLPHLGIVYGFVVRHLRDYLTYSIGATDLALWAVELGSFPLVMYRIALGTPIH